MNSRNKTLLQKAKHFSTEGRTTGVVPWRLYRKNSHHTQDGLRVFRIQKPPLDRGLVCRPIGGLTKLAMDAITPIAANLAEYVRKGQPQNLLDQHTLKDLRTAHVYVRRRG